MHDHPQTDGPRSESAGEQRPSTSFGNPSPGLSSSLIHKATGVPTAVTLPVLAQFERGPRPKADAIRM